MTIRAFIVGLLVLCWSSSLPAQGMPVIDTAAIAKQVEAASLMAQQLGQLERQATQLEQTYRALSGNRGLAALLDGEAQQLARHFLPDSAADLNALGSPSAITSFAAMQQRIVQLSALVSTLPRGYFPSGSTTLADLQSNATRLATQQATAELSYNAAVGHLPDIEAMLGAVANTSDAKGIGEIQARIQAEQAFIAAEQNRLAALLYQQNAQLGVRSQQEDDGLRQAGRRIQSPVVF